MRWTYIPSVFVLHKSKTTAQERIPALLSIHPQLSKPAASATSPSSSFKNRFINDLIVRMWSTCWEAYSRSSGGMIVIDRPHSQARAALILLACCTLACVVVKRKSMRIIVQVIIGMALGNEVDYLKTEWMNGLWWMERVPGEIYTISFLTAKKSFVFPIHGSC